MFRCRSMLVAVGLILLLGATTNGQTLKATAPVLASPAPGALLTSRRPALTTVNAQGIWVPAAFLYRFEVVAADDPMTLVAGAVVSQGDGVTVFTVPTLLDFGTEYWWRVRPELDGAFGPWSETRAFRTPVEPSGPLGFTDISAASGVANPILGGHGVMFADATGDLRPDLYITMNFNDPVADQFFVHDGDSMFVEAGAARGVSDFDVGSHGAAFADLDNDGDYDLINGATGEEGAQNNVFRNNGAGFFTDVTPTNMAGRREPTRALLAFDMDRDGDLDLFGVSGWLGSGDPADERNEVYRNNGNLTWQAVTSGPLVTAPAGQGATDTDFDGDGDIDIIAANRDGDLNLLRNDGAGNFSAVDPDAVGIGRNAFSGITAADIEDDGDIDLLLVDLAGGVDTIGYLYRNTGMGVFTLAQTFTDIDGYMGGFGDLDHDGDLDLVFAGDDVSYLNNGQGVFSTGPVIPVGGIDDPRAIAFADVDADGDLDFAVGAKRSRNWLVRNDKNSGNWLKVRLVSQQGQAGAFGAKVSIYPSSAPGSLPIAIRESRSSNGYLGQDDPTLHFGLGAQESVTVIVTFLDGTTRAVTDVLANQTITVDGATGGISPMFVERHSGRFR